MAGPASSGKTSLAFSALAEATSREEAVAYIDAFNTFDPLSAARKGITLDRLLWVRCCGSLEKASVAADIIIRAGGLGIVVLDLAPADERQRPTGAVRLPSHTWFRLKQVLEGTKTVFLVLTPASLTGSASSLVLNLKPARSVWEPDQTESDREYLRQAGVFRGLVLEVEVSRGKSRGRTTFCSSL